MNASWAKRSLADDPAKTLATFQSGLEVRLIATDRTALKTCSSDEELATIVERSRDDDFDYLPVTAPTFEESDHKKRIIGLVELVSFTHGESRPHGLVRDQMCWLSEENLIGADAGILTFVRDADRRRCRLVVSGPEISGLVTLSDLQRLPVRAALFAMVTHLEMIMAESIRLEFGQSENWVTRLPEGRQAKLHDKIGKAKSQDAYIEQLLFTEFCDKVTIIKKSPDFCWERKAFEHDLARIQSLRDNLAHANDYAATRSAASRVCETVRLTDTWIERLGRINIATA
jgi:hypothetical protein